MKKFLTPRKIILFGLLALGICMVCGIIIILAPSKPIENAQNPTQTAAALQDSAPTQAPAADTEAPTITPLPTRPPLPTRTPQPTNTPQPTPTPILGLIKIGTHLVGTDIEPGIYWGLAGEGLETSCYWERLKNLSGDLDSILANSNSFGQFYVEVKDTDFALQTSCELIQLEYAAIMEVGENIPIGMYIIGRDLKPGLYQGLAGEDIGGSCYWERLKDVSGSMDSIIANDNATGTFYIQVQETDFALLTQCPLTTAGG